MHSADESFRAAAILVGSPELCVSSKFLRFNIFHVHVPGANDDQLQAGPASAYFGLRGVHRRCLSHEGCEEGPNPECRSRRMFPHVMFGDSFDALGR